MARYQVPQFLEIEDKIFGPLTLKQFLYTMAGGAIMYMAWSNLPVIFAVILGGPIFALFIALAFYKVNNRPLSKAMEHAFTYARGPKLYLWKKRERTPERAVAETLRHATAQDLPSLSGSKLKDMSWGLDIHETLDTLRGVSEK